MTRKQIQATPTEALENMNRQPGQYYFTWEDIRLIQVELARRLRIKSITNYSKKGYK